MRIAPSFGSSLYGTASASMSLLRESTSANWSVVQPSTATALPPSIVASSTGCSGCRLVPSETSPSVGSVTSSPSSPTRSTTVTSNVGESSTRTSEDRMSEATAWSLLPLWPVP